MKEPHQKVGFSISDHLEETAATQFLHANGPRPGSKAGRILASLKVGSLNRFEAAHLGDSVLNSTVAELRSKGYPIVSVWERVPNRFGSQIRVCRYWISRKESQ